MRYTLLILCAAGAAGGGALGLGLRPERGAAGARRTPAAVPSPAKPPAVEEPGQPVDFTARIAASPALSGTGLQLLFMQWFEQEADLWPRFQELEKQYPDRTADLTAAFFTAWALRDGNAACAKIASSSLKDRGSAIVATWQVACAQGNPSGAPPEAGIYVRDWSSLERLAARDPQTALAFTASLRDTSRPPASLLALARGWAARDGAAAAEWAAGIKESGEEVFRTACLEWERRNPGALAGAGGSLRERMDADPTLATLTVRPGPASFLFGNPEAAVAAALNPFTTWREVMEGMERTATAGVKSAGHLDYPANTGEWSPADPGAVLRELQAAPAGVLRDRLAATLLRRWELSDPEAAAAFAKSGGLTLPPRPMSAADSWKKVENLPLNEAVRVAMPEGKAPDFNALSAAVSRQMKQDPAVATALLDQHMEQVVKGEGSWGMVLNNAAMQWSEMDVNAAVEWAASLPAGRAREWAIGGVLQALSDYDPAAALTWMTAMRNPDSGSTNPGQVAGDLRQRIGRFGARRIIEASALPVETKQELIKTLR